MGDPLAFANKLAEAVVASGLDADESAASGPGNAIWTPGWRKWLMGELPEDNEHDVRQDTMIGFRSMVGTSAELFDVDAVGILAPLTSIDAIVE
jgi:hypothetical protein